MSEPHATRRRSRLSPKPSESLFGNPKEIPRKIFTNMKVFKVLTKLKTESFFRNPIKFPMKNLTIWKYAKSRQNLKTESSKKNFHQYESILCSDQTWKPNHSLKTPRIFFTNMKVYDVLTKPENFVCKMFSQFPPSVWLLRTGKT